MNQCSTGIMEKMLVAAGLVLAACAAWGQPVDPAKVNETVISQDWWSAVRKGIAQSEYNITWQEKVTLHGLDAAWQAPNRAHNLRTYFTDGGPRVVGRTANAGNWTWGLELVTFGTREGASAVSPARNQCADDNRITFERAELAEWYVNAAAGLEQGFTIYQPPVPDGDLVVRMAVRGNLTPSITADGSSVDFLTADGVAVIRYSGLYAVDAAGKPLQAAMAVVGDFIELRVAAGGAAYPVTIDPVATTALWMAESNQAASEFGYCVSTAGDVNGDGYGDVIVGAPRYDAGADDEGCAFVYHGSATGLAVSPNLRMEGNQLYAWFGTAVATAGDVNGDGFSDVIVGAPKSYSGEVYEGRAFVYHGSASGLSAAANWTAESNQADANLGYSVAAAGDVNGDGYGDVIVGAQHYDNGQSLEGRAVVYFGAASGLSAAAGWTVESNQAGARLGYSVSTAGDVNGDGYGDVIIGAVHYDSGEVDEGRAFVYLGSSSGLSTTAAWTAEGNQEYACFGGSVSAAGDVNGDGYADLVVGAYVFDATAQNVGRACVYYGSAAGPSAAADWVVEGNQSDGRLGCSVCAAGDVNGDGFCDVVVGQNQYGSGQTYEGRAHVYYGSRSGLWNAPGWTVESDQAFAEYGFSVSTAGDVNGDGYADIIVGAPKYANGQTEEGRVFVYYGSPVSLSATALWLAQGGQAAELLGTSVSTAGDVNGDSHSDVIVGAPGYDGGQDNEGRVHVFHGSESGLPLLADWTAESDSAGANFGYSVSTAGDVNGDGYGEVIVGANTCSNGQAGEGRAFVYIGSQSGLYPVPSWTAESNQAGAAFGNCVSSAGDVNGDGYGDVIVGARSYSNGQSGEGRAYVYCGSMSGLSATANWTSEGDQTNAYFGESVSTAGDVNGDGYGDVVVGTPFYDNLQQLEGIVRVYYGSASGLPSLASWTKESNEANAYFGCSVDTAGDVNGDGYSDVIVGASSFDGLPEDYGRAMVYCGSASGLSMTEAWTVTGGMPDGKFGLAVSHAGDVDGDGYSDVIVGAPYYGKDEVEEGRISLYCGSSSGLSSTENWSMESNIAQGHFGYAMASAGDVNGDGYADIITGIPVIDIASGNEGAVFVFFGNGEAGQGVSLNPCQRRGDNTAPLAPMGTTPGTDVRLAVLGRTPFGRAKVKLECEVKPLGSPFDGTGTVKTPSWTSTGVEGAQLNQLVTGLYAGTAHHWRARLLYNPVNTPFQQRSRWFAVPTNGAQEGDFRVSVAPITGSIIINGNRSATNNRAVTLSLTWAGGAGTGVVRMRFSDDGANWTAWEPLAATRSHTLPAGEEHKTVRVQYLDKLNNRSDVFSDYIRLDTTLPTGSILINNGASTTTTRAVTLNLTYADTGTGVVRMRFSDDGAHWTGWVYRATTYAHTLPLASLGYQTVRVQYLDGANNYSPVYNDYIKLVAP